MKDKEKQIIESCKNCVCNAVCSKKLDLKYFFDNHDCEHYQPKLPEDSVVLSREEYVKKMCGEYEEGIKNCKFHYEYMAIPHIIQVIKDKPDISDVEIEELIRQVGVEIKE